MNEAIEQRVEEFVQEILSLVEQARGESRAAALQIVTTMLAAVHDAASNHDARQSPAEPPAPRSRKQRTPAPRATRKPARPAPEATAPPISAAPAAPASAAPASAAPSPIPAPPAETAGEAAGPLPEREALVLSAVRGLGRATAAEIAGHCGQPNGSVAVALRGLAARGLVAKAESARGYEYTLVGAGVGAGVGARRTSAA